MDNLIFKEYKDLTIEIINEITNEADVEDLFNKRENVIRNILKSGTSSEIRESYISLGLKELDDKLKDAIINEQILVKNELRDIHNKKNANRVYNNNANRVNFLNKQI